MEGSFRILVVDDEPRGVELLARCLQKLGRVERAGSGEEAWQLARDADLDLVVTDQRMPGLSGVELLTRVAERSPATGRILITGYTDLASTIDAINRGRVHAHLTKPCAPEELQLTARSVLERVALARDNDRLVADLSAANRELQRTLDSLARAQRRSLDAERLAAIGRMIAMIVHDLRGPLTTILSASAEIRRRDPADPGAPAPEELAGEIHAEAERLQRMCADLLDVTRASEAAAERVEEELDGVVESALATLVDEASRAGVELELDLASGARVLVDEDGLRRALRNLVQNALDAMPDGGALRVSTACEEGAALVCVADTGVGIPEEIRDRIFEPFVTARKKGGTGLGLAIVKKVVDDHGGTIAATKPEGGGTAFLLRLPLAPASR
jgi:signal transduction histidine kinase